ncbi:MAG TPA: hypothetical protein VIS95_06240 [Solirubrobacterales bacterium]
MDERGEQGTGDGMDVNKVRRWVLAGLIAAGVVVLAIVLFGGDSGDDSSTTGEAEAEAVALSEAELLAEASGLGGTAYWVGPREDTESYELTTTEDGRIYIRYLTGDAEAGDESAEFVSVGTYPLADAKAALQRSAVENGGTVENEQGFDLLLGTNNNAYVVFDDEPGVQVEIYSPEPGEAEQLARDGSLTPLG